jgi:molecular chaperone GrpE
MTDENVKQDPTQRTSFENPAVDPADAVAQDEPSSLGSGEYSAIGEEGALIAGVLERELADAKDKYVRLMAEFDNFRRRTVRERQEAEHRGMGNMLRGMLEMLDDLSRFAHLDPATVDSKTVVDGVQMVEKKLLKSLSGHGLEVVDPRDQPFDPAVHEAITTTPATTAEEDHLIAQVFQVGYVFNGTLLRPARVVVRQWNG